MHHLKVLRVISLVLGFVLVIFGCTTNKNQAVGAEIGLKTEAVPEGILLTFSEIPNDTARLWIGIQNRISDNEPESARNFAYSYSDLRDDSLEQVKQTKKVILPVVRAGQNYTITVMFQNEKFADITDWVYADCVAGDGIYFDYNDIQFDLNNANSAVTISSEPIFSSEVIFAPRKYSFAITVFNSAAESEVKSAGIGEHHYPSGLTSDGLTWTFEPYFTDALRESNYMETGSYPAFGTAYCNIIYDNIKWTIEIAKSQEFTYFL